MVNLADTASPVEHRGASSARRLWLNIHLTIALALGALLAITGLSGAALVLKGPLLRHDFGAATFDVTTAAAPWTSLDGWVENARREYPQVHTIVSLHAPGDTPLPTQAALVTAVLADGGFGFVTIDPHTAQPLGFFRYGEGWLFTLLDLHRRLLPESLEDMGENLVATLGVALLVSIGTGLYLWWPRSGGWRRALQVRGGPSRWRSLHTTAALCAVIPLTLIAISGVLLAKPHWLVALSPSTPLLVGTASQPCRTVRTYDDAVSTALGVTQARRFSNVALTPGGDYLIAVREAGPSHTQQGNVRVQGRCGFVSDAVTTKPPESRYMQSLHANLRLGWVGALTVFLSGLALPALYITGLALWWRTRMRSRLHLHATPRKSRRAG